MEVARVQVEEIVHRETRAWDTKDVDLLLSVFHPDMVWPWPRSYTAHDPAEWRLVMGKFDANRWRRRFQELFDTHDLVHNRREIVYVEVSAERDAGLAVATAPARANPSSASTAATAIKPIFRPIPRPA